MPSRLAMIAEMAMVRPRCWGKDTREKMMPTVTAFRIMAKTWCTMSSQALCQHSLGHVLPYPVHAYIV